MDKFSLYEKKIIKLKTLWKRFDGNEATEWKMSKYGVVSGPHFPVFRLNTEIFSVNLRIQSDYRKVLTKNNLDTFHAVGF